MNISYVCYDENFTSSQFAVRTTNSSSRPDSGLYNPRFQPRRDDLRFRGCDTYCNLNVTPVPHVCLPSEARMNGG